MSLTPGPKSGARGHLGAGLPLGQLGRTATILLVPLALLALAFVIGPGRGGASSAVTVGSVRLLAGALIVAVLLWGAARLVRRLPMGRLLPGAEGPIRVVSRTYLGARDSLCLIEVGPTTLLVAITATAVTTLHVWPDGVGGRAGARDQAQPGTGPARETMNVFPGQLEGLRTWLSTARR